MKKNFLSYQKTGTAILIMTLGIFISCKKDSDPVVTAKNPVASFQFEKDRDSHLKINFTNESHNGTVGETGGLTYAWDFGVDDVTTDVSTEEDPSYIYIAEGTYKVTLTVTGATGTEPSKTDKMVTISDPVAMGNVLTGTDVEGRTWQLLDNLTDGMGNPSGFYPLAMGQQADRPTTLWTFGGPPDNDNLCVRACILNDIWTFKPNGEYVFDNKGDAWGEGGVWSADLNETCFDATVANAFTGKDGQDLSGWNSGTHQYEYNATAISAAAPMGTITVTGGYIGLTKAGTTGDISAPASSVSYNVLLLRDSTIVGVGTIGLMVLETSTQEGAGYWRFVLISYPNATSFIPITACPLAADFSVSTNNLVATFTNESSSATSYQWDFGVEGVTDDASTDESPMYTYSEAGTYMVTLIASDGTNSEMISKEVTITSGS